MKKIAVTIGLAAFGAAGVHAAYAPDMSNDKIWSVSATLRGFYNDNYAYVNHGSDQGSFGYEVTPQFQIVKPMNQTEMGLRYIYSLYYYGQADTSGQHLNPYNQTHWVNLWLDHVFNERWEAKASDIINVTQFPFLAGVGATPSPFDNGNYINNAAQASISTDWTRELGTVLTYNNNLWMYNQGGGTLGDLFPAGTVNSNQVTHVVVDGTGRGPSPAGQYNRMDQSITLDLQWHSSTETIWGVGYTFDFVNYTAGEPIGFSNSGYPEDSGVLNSRSHTLYLSYQHNLTDVLRATVQVGGQYEDSYNQNSTSLAPYANISATYTYAQASYVAVGFVHSISQTYLAANYAAQDFTNNVNGGMESSTLYATLNHQITPKLVGLLTARYQTGDFIGGQYNGQYDSYYSASANLNYTIMPHLSVEIGYVYNQVDSVEPGSSYRQNQYEIGVTGSY